MTGFARHLFLYETLCWNFTCIFDSVDSPYCVGNLHQISLGPTFLLVRNFITARCAIVIGTSLLLILNSINWGEGRVWWWGEEGPHSPPHCRTRSLPKHAHSLVATDRSWFIFDLPSYLTETIPTGMFCHHLMMGDNRHKQKLDILYVSILVH